jgi:hypothetical protein
MNEKHWRKLYRTTVPGSEREKLRAHVKAEEGAINGSDVVLNGTIPRGERIAMGNALSALWVLKRERGRRIVAESKHCRDA